MSPVVSIAVAIGIAVLIAIVYSPVRKFGFVYLDDPVYVADNSWVLKGLSWAGLKWALTAEAAGNWHPLTWISHMVDVRLYGTNAGMHHVTSVWIHTLNSVLVFLAFYRMTRAQWKSAFVAALFALHPLHVESVAWISERKDVLSTLFWILTIHAYLWYVHKRGARRMIGVMVVFALALMSKPMVVTLPFTLLLLDFWPLRRITPDDVTSPGAWWPLIREKFPLFLLTASAMVVTIRAPRDYGAVVSVGQLPVGDRAANAAVSYVAYIRDTVWPAKLAAFYPFHTPAASTANAALAALALITFFALRHIRTQPFLAVGWLWYLGTLVPAIGLVQVGDQARADRFTYVPLIGLFLIAAWGGSRLVQGIRRRYLLSASIAATTIALCTLASIRQVGYWKDNLTLFTRAVAVTSGNYRAHALLGVALSAKGQNNQAVEHYRASLAILPANSEARSNLGATLVDLGRSDEALEEFAEAVRYQPGAALYHYNYGVVLSEKERLPEAVAEIATAARLDPANKTYADALALLTGNKKR